MLDPINNMLEYACPHCAAIECDDYEVLDLDRPVRLRCGTCGGSFAMLAIECAACERDIVGTWRYVAEARASALPALCAACAAKSRRHEDPAPHRKPVAAKR